MARTQPHGIAGHRTRPTLGLHSAYTRPAVASVWLKFSWAVQCRRPECGYRRPDPWGSDSGPALFGSYAGFRHDAEGVLGVLRCQACKGVLGSASMPGMAGVPGMPGRGMPGMPGMPGGCAGECFDARHAGMPGMPAGEGALGLRCQACRGMPARVCWAPHGRKFW